MTSQATVRVLGDIASKRHDIPDDGEQLMIRAGFSGHHGKTRALALHELRCDLVDRAAHLVASVECIDLEIAAAFAEEQAAA